MINESNVLISDFDELIIFTSLSFLILTLVLIFFFYFSRKKIMKFQLDKRDLVISHQKEMLSSIINTQENERKRIAQDLHDDISSNLNIVSLNSHLLQKPNLSAGETIEITKNIIQLTQKSLENSRRIAHDLYPPVLEKFGLEAGIRELCFDYSTTKAVEINFDNKVDFTKTSQEIQMQIFRVLQELISNSLRHGKAKKINIVLNPSGENHGICIYNDNGQGFNIADGAHKKGLGMKNIDSRISLIGGKITFESKINSGVNVIFNF